MRKLALDIKNWNMLEGSSEKIIRVAIAEDHKILRETLRTILDEETNLKVVLEAENGLELNNQLRQTKVDVLLLDIEMPIMNGLEALKIISRSYPEIKVLILSMHDDVKRIRKYLLMGAKGYLPKTCDYFELLLAINTVDENRAYIYNATINTIYSELKKSSKQVKRCAIDEPLTLFEHEILKLVCMQKTHREIAAELNLSHRTVENHTSKIREKTGTTNRIGLMAYALKYNLVSY